MTKKIAWADSESFNTESYRDFISWENKGIDIQLYRWADEALNKIKATNFDLIVINTYLNPGINHAEVEGWRENPNNVGLDLIERIRKSNQKTPIILIAVDSLEEIYKEEGGKDYILGRGASEVIDLKKMLPSEFNEVVRQYLRE